jgi:two-component system sensor histidine kinase QseC
MTPPRPPGRAWSLHRTLLALLLTLTVSVWSLSTLLVYIEADQESQELFDQSLKETAHLLLALADHEMEEKRTDQQPMTLAGPGTHDQYLRFQIWDENRRLLYKNQGAPDQPFVASDASGYGTTRFNGQPWRTYAAWNGEHHVQIQVAEPNSHRKDISGRFAYKLLLFALIVIPLMAGAIWWSVKRVFRALSSSADQVSQRTPNDLRKVDLDGAPVELHALLHAINRLFERVGRALEREQRFTADASHELRTPLAAIKTNLQVIQRARNDGERAEAAAGLSISVDRATRLVEQLMALSRLDPQYVAAPAPQPIDLAALIASQLPDLRRQADKKAIAVGSDLRPATCLANLDSILILLRNLSDNALRYTPQQGRVEIRCWTEQGRARLRVADSGAGIPPDMRERVFERFVRLPGTGASGSGLGLSIVKNIADIHQAGITLGEGLDGAGLAVEIDFA